MRKHVATKPLLALLCLSCAFASTWVAKATSSAMPATYLPSTAQRLVPERLRSFVAALMWSRADHYTHTKSMSPVDTGFRPGSYAGNTDILPLMQMIMKLMPEELSIYQLQARNLARYLGQPFIARVVLRQAILQNPFHPLLYELYASMAFVWIFGELPSTQQANAAIKYLDKAISLYPETESAANPPDPAYSPENFHVLKARLFLELGQPDKALNTWKQSGLPLSGDDRIVQILRDYQLNGIAPAQLFEPIEEPKEPQEQKPQPQTTLTVEFNEMLRALAIAFSLLILAATARHHQSQKISQA